MNSNDLQTVCKAYNDQFNALRDVMITAIEKNEEKEIKDNILSQMILIHIAMKNSINRNI